MPEGLKYICPRMIEESSFKWCGSRDECQYKNPNVYKHEGTNTFYTCLKPRETMIQLDSSDSWRIDRSYMGEE